MNKKRHFLLSAVLATTLAANAQVTINVDASNPGLRQYGFARCSAR